MTQKRNGAVMGFPKVSLHLGRRIEPDAAILAYRAEITGQIIYRILDNIRAGEAEANRLVSGGIAHRSQIVCVTVQELMNRWFDFTYNPESPPRGSEPLRAA